MKNKYIKMILTAIVLIVSQWANAEIITAGVAFVKSPISIALDTETGEMTVSGNNYYDTGDTKYFVNNYAPLVKKLIIKENITELRGSYEEFTNLEEVVFENKISLGANFHNCKKLKKIIIPDYSYFSPDIVTGCTSLNYLYIGETSYVFGGTFKECSGTFYYNNSKESGSLDLTNSWFTTIKIGEKVTDISKWNLNSNKLNWLIFASATPPAIGALKLNENVRIFVPTESLQIYKNTWKNLSDKILPFDDEESGTLLIEGATERERRMAMALIDASSARSIFLPNVYETDITEISLRKNVNPNCLFYVPLRSELNGDNIVKCDGTTCMTNNITLIKDYPFGAAISFETTHAEYVFKPSIWADSKGGWETICLPFVPDSYMANVAGNIWPVTLGGHGNFWLRKYVGSSNEALYFTSTIDGKMEENTPHIIAFPGSSMGKGHLQGQTITFSAVNTTIHATSIPQIKRGRFTFIGNYDSNPDPAENAWALDESGTSFNAAPMVGDKPFSGYFVPEASMNNVKALRIEFINSETDGMLGIPAQNAYNNGITYDLTGRKVLNTNKGFIIQNGKKYFKK